MTPAEFIEARQKLGLSFSEIAAALGYADGRTTRRFASGDRDIPPDAAERIRRWVDVEEGRLPRFIFGDDPEGREWVIHLGPAGFVAAAEALVDGAEDITVTRWLDWPGTDASALARLMRVNLRIDEHDPATEDPELRAAMDAWQGAGSRANG